MQPDTPPPHKPTVPPAESAGAVLPLRRWERRGLWALLALVIVFGGIVEMRSAFMKRRMTDSDVYFRGAWAVRTGADLYGVTDTNRWHYNYPPLLAIALMPLANPPPGEETNGFTPYPVSVAIWYAVNVLFLWVAVHWLASALGRAAPGFSFPRFSRGWWGIRMVPVLLCIIFVGRTLSRGQVNMIILLFLCGMAALMLERRRFLSGACLAGAVCIKVIPAFLLVHALVRRDLRSMMGTAAGLLLGVIVIPAIVMGPLEMAGAYQRYAERVLLPGIGLGTDTSRGPELMHGTGSQSFKWVLHRTLHLDPHAPPDVSLFVRLAHWGIGGVFTVITLLVGLQRRRGDAISELLFLGALIVVMVPISPAGHTHYFMLSLPLVLALVAHGWEQHGFPRIGRNLVVLFACTIGANVITALEIGGNFLREMGVPLYAGLAVWAGGLLVLRRRAALTGSSPATSLPA
jgi:hypothetical protein